MLPNTNEECMTKLGGLSYLFSGEFDQVLVESSEAPKVIDAAAGIVLPPKHLTELDRLQPCCFHRSPNHVAPALRSRHGSPETGFPRDRRVGHIGRSWPAGNVGRRVGETGARLGVGSV